MLLTFPLQRHADTPTPPATSTPTVTTAPGRQATKLRNSSDKPGSIIWTRSHMVRFDARAKPAGSVLQAIALTRHLLVVGASLRDDNVIRLFLEVAEYTRGAHSGPVAGTYPIGDGPVILPKSRTTPIAAVNDEHFAPPDEPIQEPPP